MTSRQRPSPTTWHDTLMDLTISDSPNLMHLVKAMTTAHRVDWNWCQLYQPRLRKILCFYPGAKKRSVDIAALLVPGSRYLISTDYFDQEKHNRLTISDIHQQGVVGLWDFSEEQRVLMFRPVENGSAIMFLFHPGVVSP